MGDAAGALGGITFVDGITKLGSEEAASVLRPGFSVLCPACFPPTQRKAHEVFVRCCGCALPRNPRGRICTSRWGITSRSHHRCARHSSHARSTTMISCRRSRAVSRCRLRVRSASFKTRSLGFVDAEILARHATRQTYVQRVVLATGWLAQRHYIVDADAAAIIVAARNEPLSDGPRPDREAP